MLHELLHVAFTDEQDAVQLAGSLSVEDLDNEQRKNAFFS